MAKVFVQSFGCRASQADGAAIETALDAYGWEPVRDVALADLVVVNTCTVTQAADVDARRVIRTIHRQQPDAEILVTGCYAQRAAEELATLDGVRWVVGNSHKSKIAEIVASPSTTWREDYHGQIYRSDFARDSKFEATAVPTLQDDRTRPNLKVQDGCSNRCSFCIIPSVRGPSRSAPLESVVEQVSELSARHAEVVLTGINLGRWGRDLPGRWRFVDLLRAILEQTSVRRLRISSIEPMDWSEELLELVAAEDRIAKHVHLPLQSGSDAVLKRMFRKYRTRHYQSRLQLARQLMPHAAIGADVMTGFPGETEAEFDETVRFIEDQPFTYLHVFTYSERPGTAAADYGGAVPVRVRRERTRVLRELGAAKNHQFRKSFVGKRVSAVTLEEHGIALTTNFLRLEMAQNRPSNQILDLEIGGISDTGLRERAMLLVLG